MSSSSTMHHKLFSIGRCKILNGRPVLKMSKIRCCSISNSRGKPSNNWCHKIKCLNHLFRTRHLLSKNRFLKLHLCKILQLMIVMKIINMQRSWNHWAEDIPRILSSQDSIFLRTKRLSNWSKVKLLFNKVQSTQSCGGS